jgi:thiosulfate/3-mercaptopyruvate sulfurtransferase
MEVLTMKNVVTAEWLLQNLKRDDIIVLDCRYDMNNLDYGLNEYKKAHIRKAQFVSLEDDLTGKKGVHGGRHPLPDMNEFARKMESLGVDDEKTVVVYDDYELTSAGRLWWMLKYIGKDNVYVLEGGFKGWGEKGFETTDKAEESPKSNGLSVNLQNDMLCYVNYVKERIDDPNSIIVDSRTKERYLGLVEPIDKKAGHIPGAANHFYKDNFDGLKIKDVEALKEMYKDLERYKNIIIHCGSGITACPNIIAMEEIGLKPIFYLGGWSDWISYDENPIETQK